MSWCLLLPDIASESNDKFEIDLKTLIQIDLKTLIQKSSKFICSTQEGKQIITPTATPAPKTF